MSHEHILPLLGVSEELFPGELCLIMPFQVNGNVLSYLKERYEVEQHLVTTVNTWVRWFLSHLHIALLIPAYSASPNRLSVIIHAQRGIRARQHSWPQYLNK